MVHKMSGDAEGSVTKTDCRDVDDARQALLEQQYNESRSAFTRWESAQDRSDQALYKAIGQFAEFAAAVGNNHRTLMEFAAKKGMRPTKASTLYTVTTRLIVTDRKKASKYATVLQLAAREGIQPIADSIVKFLKAEGGIEACLKKISNFI